jgi:hypothetical protein
MCSISCVTVTLSCSAFHVRKLNFISVVMKTKISTIFFQSYPHPHHFHPFYFIFSQLQTFIIVKIFQGKLLKMRREREGKDRTLIRSVTLSLRFLYFTSTIFLSHPISIFFKTEKNCEVKCF